MSFNLKTDWDELRGFLAESFTVFFTPLISVSGFYLVKLFDICLLPGPC